MPLIQSFEEIIPDQFYLYSCLKEKMEPLGRLSQIVSDLDEAFENYNPLAYENERSFQKLNQVIQSLKKPEWKQNETASLLLSLACSWLSAMQFCKKQERKALKTIDKAIDAIKKLPESLNYCYLQGANYIFRADLIEKIGKENEAIEDYDYGLTLLEKAISHQESEDLKGLLASIQRASLKAGNLRFHQKMANPEFNASKAVQNYLNSIEAARKFPEESLAQSTLYAIDGIETLFTTINTVAAMDEDPDVYYLTLLKWQALFSLIDPNLEEMEELMILHFLVLIDWLNQEEMKDEKSQKFIDELFDLLSRLPEHSLMLAAQEQEENPLLQKGPLILLDTLQKEYSKAKKHSSQNKKIAADFASDLYFKAGLAEQELEKGCLKAFYQGLHTLPDELEKEKEALEKALVYALALKDYQFRPFDGDRYKYYLFEIEKVLGLMHAHQTEDLPKARHFLEEALKIGKELRKKDLDPEPIWLAQIYDELISIYIDLDNQSRKIEQYDRASTRLEREQKSWDRYIGKAWWDRDLNEEEEVIYDWIDSMSLIEKFRELENGQK